MPQWKHQQKIKVVTNCSLLTLRKCYKKYIESSTYFFNPYHLKDDEHGGNKIGMQDVFGEAFLNERASTCEFH